MAAACAMGAAESRYAPLLVAGFGASLLCSAARWLIRRGVLAMRAQRRQGVNLIATRGPEPPSLWLAAHLDSKSQPIPTIVRTAGLVIESAGYLIASVLAILSALNGPAAVGDGLWLAAAIVTTAGAIPVMMSVVGDGSPGAFDNASGVATVLHAARLLGSECPAGVVLTDAEELGLAGARAWADTASSRAAVVVLNCDGVDDVGAVTVMHAGREPTALLDFIRRASAAAGVRFRSTVLVPGLLTDSVAFSDNGRFTVTFSRGTLRSLARVHSRRDDLAHLNGTGIAETAELMAATIRVLNDSREHEWKS